MTIINIYMLHQSSSTKRTWQGEVIFLFRIPKQLKSYGIGYGTAYFQKEETSYQQLEY